MSETNPHVSVSIASEYSFAGFQLKVDGTLWSGNEVVHLPPKELAALRFLLEHAGQVVSPQQLMEALWSGVHVTADSVSKCLSSLRARLEPAACIQTIYKRGYRFSAELLRKEPFTAVYLARLAVMPFETGLSVPEHLGPSLAEGIIARLSSQRRDSLAVLARDSVFTLARRGKSALEVGRELRADLVFSGHIEALTGFLRARLEMIRVADGTQLWAEDLMLEQERLSELELEIVARLMSRVGVGNAAFAAAERSFNESRPAAHPHPSEAYASFLRGHYEWQSLHRSRMQEGMRHLTRASELDPSLLAARVDLVQLAMTQCYYGFMAPRAAADQIRRTSLELPPASRQMESVLPAIGLVHLHVDHDLAAAVEAFDDSSHLPHDSWTTRARVHFELSRHHFTEAIELLAAAQAQDPCSPWIEARLAWALHLNRDAAASLEQIERCLKLFPEHLATGIYGTILLAWSGQLERALEMALSLTRRFPYFDLGLALEAYVRALDGQSEYAAQMMERLEWLGRERYVMKSFSAATYLALGKTDMALTQLRTAAEERCPWFLPTLADPRLDAIAALPAFGSLRQILSRMEDSLGGKAPWPA